MQVNVGAARLVNSRLWELATQLILLSYKNSTLHRDLLTLMNVCRAVATGSYDSEDVVAATAATNVQFKVYDCHTHS